jgi:hypothetical protein
VIDSLATDGRVAWHKPADQMPPRLVPVLCAWNLGTGWMYNVAKWTGKRWLETIPETANEEFTAPDYWQQIEAPT